MKGERGTNIVKLETELDHRQRAVADHRFDDVELKPGDLGKTVARDRYQHLLNLIGLAFHAVIASLMSITGYIPILGMVLIWASSQILAL